MERKSVINYFYKKIKKILRKFRNNKTFSGIKNKLERVFVSVGYPICDDNDYKEYLEFKKRYSSVTSNIHFIIIKGYKTSISDKLKKKISEDKNLDKGIKVTFNGGSSFFCTNNNKIICSLILNTLSGEDKILLEKK